VIASKLNKLDLTENAQDLMRKLLKTNPSERISAQAALQHDYFDNT
jgi:serine/threonine protein kinase